MRDLDHLLLEMAYDMVVDKETSKVIHPNPKELIGKFVKVHPAISGTPESDPKYFMAWSVKTKSEELDNKGKEKWKVAHNARTLLLKTCKAEIDHNAVAKHQLNSKIRGKKTPNLLVEGTVVDIDFDFNKIQSILSQGGWESATYNPHKHDEYIYKNKLPDWWNTDERFHHFKRGGEEERLKAGIEKRKENFPYNNISKKINETTSRFDADYCLFKQYLNRGEDYFWVKGVEL